jgi:hypothetical protein
VPDAVFWANAVVLLRKAGFLQGSALVEVACAIIQADG